VTPQQVVRGQFRGYHDEPGVAPASTVETYAAMRLDVDSWRWSGVPFYIRAGKSLALTATEVYVDLKRPPLSRLSPRDSNYVRFRLGPTLSISVGVRVKRPGAEIGSMPSELMVVRDTTGDEVVAYERLLTDAMNGDQTLFVREDAIEASWRVVENILDDATPVYPYEPGSWGPAEADALVSSSKGWHNPAR
jgi:glucose-6-phosphate 1-dehydrogenase